MRALMTTAAAVMFTALGTIAAAQDHAAHAAHAGSAAQSFEHYEGVRAALSADRMADGGFAYVASGAVSHDNPFTTGQTPLQIHATHRSSSAITTRPAGAAAR